MLEKNMANLKGNCEEQSAIELRTMKKKTNLLEEKDK
jgi:hypothetical protein